MSRYFLLYGDTRLGVLTRYDTSEIDTKAVCRDTRKAEPYVS